MKKERGQIKILCNESVSVNISDFNMRRSMLYVFILHYYKSNEYMIGTIRSAIKEMGYLQKAE